MQEERYWDSQLPQGCPDFRIVNAGRTVMCNCVPTSNRSLGNVSDRYVFEGEGGDQFCGRTVCGLSIMSVAEFACLPPHLHPTAASNILADHWRTWVPIYDRLPASFRQCLPHLLASLIYHQDFLRSSLP